MQGGLQVDCKVEIPNELTVGTEFTLSCDGQWPSLNPNKIELRLDPADTYKLRLLDFQYVTKDKLLLKVTSYQPGQHQLKAVQLVDDAQSVVLGDLSFTVASVLNPTEPEQEPFGPMGPISLRTPIWYWLAWVFVIVAVSAFIYLKIKRRVQRQKLLNELQTHDSSMLPLHQFNLVFRQLQRRFAFFTQSELPVTTEPGEAVSELSKAFRIFLGRLLQVPALQWSDRLILRDIKTHHRKVYPEIRDDLKKFLAELDRALKANSKLAAKDAIQLFEMARKVADKIHQNKARLEGS